MALWEHCRIRRGAAAVGVSSDFLGYRCRDGGRHLVFCGAVGRGPAEALLGTRGRGRCCGVLLSGFFV